MGRFTNWRSNHRWLHMSRAEWTFLPNPVRLASGCVFGLQRHHPGRLKRMGGSLVDFEGPFQDSEHLFGSRVTREFIQNLWILWSYIWKNIYRNTSSAYHEVPALCWYKVFIAGCSFDNTTGMMGFEHQRFQGPEGWLNAIIPPGWNRETGSNSWYQQNQAPLIADFFVGRGSCIQAAESGEDLGTGGTSTYWWCSPHEMLGFSVAQPLCFWRREDTWETKLRSELFWNLEFWSVPCWGCSLLASCLCS